MPLYIDDVLMPEPKHKAISCSNEKVWSANTGRTKSGRMQGSIIEIKKTRNIEFPPLTKGELELLENKISTKKEWHTLRLEDTSGNIVCNFECYFGTATYSIYSFAAGCRYYTDYKVEAIER